MRQNDLEETFNIPLIDRLVLASKETTEFIVHFGIICHSQRQADICFLVRKFTVKYFSYPS
jgi:hypothetical protein